MIKKRILIIFLIFMSFSLLQAQVSPEDEEEKIDNAYSWLLDEVQENCDSLTTEEKIFSLLAINECRIEVINDSSNEECWPVENCRLKRTAQAVLALDSVGVDTVKAQEWILSQNKTPSELTWYLQIESNEQTTCSIGYSGFSNIVNIMEDKKISGDAGPCFESLTSDSYWLKIFSSPFCYNQEFSISCDEDFSTTLLFRKQDSSIIHVFQQTSSAAATGTIIEKVESFCFRGGASGNLCNYEGSLWAALVLDSLGEDVSSYLPYLITFAEDNQGFLPDAFLYFITTYTEYSTSLLSKQKQIGSQYYWQGLGGIYYDTALALFPFKNEETFLEKTNSKQWLLEIQHGDGYWHGGNIRDTAFILASIWPRDFVRGGNGNGNGDGLQDCKSAENYCVNKGSCIGYGGEVLSDYYCSVLSECCTVQPEQPTCTEQGGEICSSNERCSGSMISAADTNNCCVDGGSCKIVTPVISECEKQQGICRGSCLSDEQQTFYSCEFTGDFCCSPKTKKSGGVFWIWFFLILIVLVVIGIIFRDKLRSFWFKIKSKSKGSKPRPKPGFPRPPHYPMRRPMPERRILPAPHRPGRSIKRRPSKSQTELDAVLKKLKGMGK